MAGDTSAMIALQPALKFNGGGHINHGIFWTNLSPNGGGEPTGIVECISATIVLSCIFELSSDDVLYF